MPQQGNDERAILLPDWPQPAVVAELRTYADESSLVVRYRAAEDKLVVVRFPLCMYVVFGAPNDEALGGHPLWNRGLEFYSVHEVISSSLIAMLERRNSVHPRHDPELYFRDTKHYVLTFQDSTLECVVCEGEHWKPTIRVFDSEAEAESQWQVWLRE
jgi:hypothetical protein